MTLEKNIFPRRSCRNSNSLPFDQGSGALPLSHRPSPPRGTFTGSGVCWCLEVVDFSFASSVLVRKRDTQRECETQRDTERQTHRETEIEREREREIELELENFIFKVVHLDPTTRANERARERERERERERQRQRQTETETERQRDSDRD